MDVNLILGIIGLIGTVASLTDLGYKYGPNLLKKLKEHGLDRVRESAQIESIKTTSLYPNLNMVCPRNHPYTTSQSLLKKI